MTSSGNIQDKCLAKERCISLSESYPYTFKPVCPVLKNIFNIRNESPLKVTKEKTLKASIYRLGLASGTLSLLLPSDYVFGLLAHKTKWHERILNPVYLDMETLPKRLEKNYPHTANKIKQLSRRMMEQFSEYEEKTTSLPLAYAIPSETGQMGLCNFLEWLNLTGSRNEAKGFCWPYPVDISVTAGELLLELVGLDRAISIDEEQLKKEVIEHNQEIYSDKAVLLNSALEKVEQRVRHNAGATKKKKTRRKTPPQLLKEARERQATQELTKDPNITADKLGKILGCNKSTVVRLKAWKNKGVLSHPAPTKGFRIRGKGDEDRASIESIDERQ